MKAETELCDENGVSFTVNQNAHIGKDGWYSSEVLAKAIQQVQDKDGRFLFTQNLIPLYANPWAILEQDVVGALVNINQVIF